MKKPSGAWAAEFHATVLSPLAHQPGRIALAVAGIALGVALGVAVHLINASVLAEFDRAVRGLAGNADVVIRGPRAGFAEELYPRIARLPEVRFASPAVEVEARVGPERTTLTILGIDPFRSAQVQPALTGDISAKVPALFDAHAVLLSVTAAEASNVAPGKTLAVTIGNTTVDLNVMGLLPAESYPQKIGIMDIASAQWTFSRLGRLNRVDLRVQPGMDVAAFQEQLRRTLPANVQAVTPEVDSARGANATRAYRVNLEMLALVALLTGGFLVFATQYLALLRRRSDFGLVRALGVTRRSLVFLLVGEGAALGAVGSALGVALGIALAAVGVERFGGDLGAGYFRTLSPSLAIEWGTLAAFFALGVGTAVLGAFSPAWDAARRAPAEALKARDEQSEARPQRPWAGLVLIAAGAGLAFAPPLGGLPWLGYASIAALLLGTITLMPRIVQALVGHLPSGCAVPAALAIAQVAGTPRQSSLSTATIVTSFSLMVAMLIMVNSFRTSLETWLERMVPADIYVRAVGDTAFFTPEQQRGIASMPGVTRADFLRSQTLLLAPDRPPLVLLARRVLTDAGTPALPLTAAASMPRANDPPPVWVSEIAADVYGFRAGDRISLPITNLPRTFTVAGVWRDYARQGGAIAMDRALYVQLTGDELANDAAIVVAPEAIPAQVAANLRQRFAGAPGIEISPNADLRAASLKTFDRTFAITYALEATAVLIGLFGVSVSFSAQVLARRRTLGMLRHLGMTRREIALMLAAEGVLVAALGAAVGLVLGFCQSEILINVVNRQSFHWSMDLAIPGLALVALAAALVAAAAFTAVVSGRSAMREDAIQAVHEDW